MASTTTATLTSVIYEPESSGLVGAHAAGATVLNVASGRVFGDVCVIRVGDNVYTGVREDDTIVLDPPGGGATIGLLVAAEDGDPVERLNTSGVAEARTVGMVDFDGDGSEDDEAEIPSGQRGYFPEGEAAKGTLVDVESTEFGYRIVSRPYVPDELDSEVIADTLTGKTVQTAAEGQRIVLREYVGSSLLLFYTGHPAEQQPSEGSLGGPGYMATSVTDLGGGDAVLQNRIAGPALTGQSAPRIELVSSRIGSQVTTYAQVFAERLTLNGDRVEAPNMYVTNAPETANAANARISTATGPNMGQLFRSTSTRRNKGNIRAIAADLTTLLSLEPKFYTSKCEMDDPETVHAGFIAEEADDLGLTEWVEYDEDGTPQNFHYERWVAALQAIVRDQQQRIEALEARLA